MKVKILVFLMVCISFASAGTNYNEKIGIIRSPDSRPCLLFQLEGVTDAGGSGNPWFAIKQDHIGYDEIVSIMLAAKLSDRAIQVGTNNVPVEGCGHVEVTVIHLP